MSIITGTTQIDRDSEGNVKVVRPASDVRREAQAAAPGEVTQQLPEEILKQEKEKTLSNIKNVQEDIKELERRLTFDSYQDLFQKSKLYEEIEKKRDELIKLQKHARAVGVGKRRFTTPEEKVFKRKILLEKRFQEQCFLVDNLASLKQNHKDNYKNFSKLRGDGSKGFITRASIAPGVEALHNATAEQLSGLIPEIKLWKIFYPTETSEGIEVALPFENYLKNSEVENMTRNRATRGAGAGIKSFEWDLEGTNLYEADKLITARLVLTFQDMNSLSKVLNIHEKDGIRFETRYLDLFHANKQYTSNSSGGGQCSVQVYNEKYFRIKARVGWSAHKDHPLYEVAKKTSHTFFLGLTRHDITFNEDATIQVVLNYQASVDSMMRDYRSDILLMDENESLSAWELAKKCYIEEISENGEKKGKRAEEAEEAERAEEEAALELLEEKITAEKEVQYRRLFDKILEDSRLYYVDITRDIIGLWQLWSSATTQEEIDVIIKEVNSRRGDNDVRSSGEASSTAADAKKQATENLKTEMADKDKSGNSDIPGLHGGTFAQESSWIGSDIYQKSNFNVHRIHYMTLGSLLNTALSVLNDNDKRLLELRSLLGDIKYIHPKTNQPQSISLADVPISLNLFQVWFYDNCVGQNKRTWHLKDFIKSLVDDLFLAAISERCFPCVSGFKKPRLNLAALQIPLNSDNSCLITGKKGVKESNNSNARLPIDKLLSVKDRSGWSNDKVGQYLFFHVSGESLSSMFGNRSKDTENGIHHLQIGSSRGMVKTISFNKEDDPHVATYRITEGESQLGALREVYNATVNMYGNTFYKPGSYVFIDSSSSVFGTSTDAAESIGSQIGLGGYYMILRVNSVISSGEYTSILDCRYEGSGKKKKPTRRLNPCEIAERNPINEVSGDQVSGVADYLLRDDDSIDKNTNLPEYLLREKQ